MTSTTTGRGFSGLHRGGAVVVGLVLWVFGILGFADGLSWFSTSGGPVLGLSSNLLLSTVSLVVGAVLFGAAWRGGRTASTTAVVVGALFLLSGVVNVVLMNTAYNVLAFRMPNVVFSLVVGLILLVLGAYGRFTGHLPDDNAYRTDRVSDPVDAEHGADNAQLLPVDAADATAARELAEAERAAAAGAEPVDPDVLRRVDAEPDPSRRRARWRETTG